MDGTVVICGLLVVVGLFGIVVPVLPGTLLVLLGFFVWASEAGTTESWSVFALAAGVLAVGTVVKYLVPGRRLKAAVPTSTLVVGGLVAIVGFFVIPVVGAAVGFVLGVFLVELGRHRDGRVAWRSTGHALKAVMMSIGIELVAGFVIVALWVVGVWRLGIPG
jgi:uncharacterized protein YqgC (DUF456 family)